MSGADLAIENAKIVTESDIFEGNVYCSEGKIIAITNSATRQFGSVNRRVNANGRLLFPGFIEPHTHLGPFNGFASDIETETRSALGGGITTVMHFLTEKGSLLPEIKRLRKLIEERSYTDAALIGVVMNQGHSDELQLYVNEGVVAFKHYMNKPEFEKFLGWTYLDEGQMLRSFEKIGRLGGLAMVHPENYEIIATRIEEVKGQGLEGLEAWEASRPWYCEQDHMMTAVLLASIARVPLYIVHVSIGSFNEVVEFARAHGVEIYLETNPAYLYFTKESEIGILGKVNPPIRGKEHREALWEGIRNGRIQCLGADHIACSKKLKLGSGDIWTAIPGLHGLEMTLPIMLDEGFHKRAISLETIVKVAATNVARIHRLPKKGEIHVGFDADLCLVDTKKEVKVTQSILHDGSDYSLYEGKLFKGWPTMTISRGEVAMEDGEIIVKPGRGRALRCLPRVKNG